MSPTTNTNQPMDTEPGGENTQYESQKITTAIQDKPSPLSQLRGPDGTVHLPTHNKVTPKGLAQLRKDAKEKEEYENEGLDYSAEALKASKGEEGISKERGEKTAENIRFGEAISEHGFGGETVGNGGSAGVGEGPEGEEHAREKQGYGTGSGIGA